MRCASKVTMLQDTYFALADSALTRSHENEREHTMTTEPEGVEDGPLLPQGPVTAPDASAEHSETMSTTKADANVSICTRRDLIDEIDRDVIGLLQRRKDLATEIQRLRMGIGGPRLSINRESEIVQRYRVGLGKPGAQVANLVLEISRGPSTTRLSTDAHADGPPTL